MVIDLHALVQREHLGEDLEDIGYVFCDSQRSSSCLRINDNA